MTAIGDEWREFALLIAKAIRPRNKNVIEFDVIATKLESVAEQEKQLYQLLMRAF
jgi:hypothetical protein